MTIVEAYKDMVKQVMSNSIPLSPKTLILLRISADRGLESAENLANTPDFPADVSDDVGHLLNLLNRYAIQHIVSNVDAFYNAANLIACINYIYFITG